MKRPGTFFFLSWSDSLVFALQPIFVLSMYTNVGLRNGCPDTDIVYARPRAGYFG